MSGRSKTDLGARLRRVLLMIPWLLREGGSTVADIAARFGVEEKEVVRDLNLIMCCGVPPYGGGDLITVMLDDDGTVEAWPGPFFTKPMQLTPAEGFAVLAAGRALQAVPGTGQTEALASALDKLEGALGASGAVAVDLESPTHLATVQRAAAQGERLRITYYSFVRDDLTDRVVEPLVVHSRDGRWYAETRDVSAGAPRERRLRVDRIQSRLLTGSSHPAPIRSRSLCRCRGRPGGSRSGWKWRTSRSSPAAASACGSTWRAIACSNACFCGSGPTPSSSHRANCPGSVGPPRRVCSRATPRANRSRARAGRRPGCGR
jgi:predicted DNA-binding transcriptional regulator YafY